MTVTYTRGVRWPIAAIAILLVLTFLIAKRGLNGTIDLGQEVLAKAAEGSTEVAETPDTGADPKTESTEIIALTPRSPNTSVGKNITIQIQDEAGNPLGDICVLLRESMAEVNRQNTNWADGKSRLNFDNIPVGTVLSLYIDPINHTNPLLNEANSFDFMADSSVFGKTFCFKRTNQLTFSGQKPIYALIDCPETETPESLTPKEGDIGGKPGESAAPSPLYFNETFDVNSRGWEEWDDKTAGNEIRGHNYFADGALHMNLLSSVGHIIHPTNVPLEKEIKNFGLFLRFSSIVQPQTADSIARLNIKFRMQPGGSHYNLSIDHTNVVSLYFIYIENGETKHEKIDAFHSEFYLIEPNAENSLNLLVEQDSIRIVINGEEERTIDTKMRYVDQAGEISLAIDSTAGNVVSYKLHELNIKEWIED